MTLLPVTLSLRARLLLAGVLVNVVMLALLIADGISVMDKKLHDRARVHLEEQKLLLNAALSIPLAGSQYQTLAQILEGVRTDSGFIYLVLFDRNDKLVASAGWERDSP
ncbi:MAG: hypothetical protein ACRET7_10320, partial [Burkholderiales bacterium]